MTKSSDPATIVQRRRADIDSLQKAVHLIRLHAAGTDQTLAIRILSQAIRHRLKALRAMGVSTD